METLIGRLDVRNGLRGGLYWGAFAAGVMMVLVVWHYGFSYISSPKNSEECLNAATSMAYGAKVPILFALSIGACSGWVSHAVRPRLGIVWSILGVFAASAPLWGLLFVLHSLAPSFPSPNPVPFHIPTRVPPLITPFELLFVSGPPLVATYLLTKARLHPLAAPYF